MSTGKPPTIQLLEVPLDRALGKLLRVEICRKVTGVVIGLVESSLVVAVADASDPAIYDLIELATEHRYKAQLVTAEPAHILLALEYVFNVPEARQGEPWIQWVKTKRMQSETLSRVGADLTGETVVLADQIIKEAIAVEASDIHLEMFHDHLCVRYRQDGLLRVVNEIRDVDLAHSLLKRLKVMANMDIVQDHVTQGGRISVELAGRGYDLRASIVPVPAGESLVMRILNKGAFKITLDTLGFSQEQMSAYKSFIERPHGLILTSGPTGSGKSTTLYASLKSIARPDRKLLTVEDPIEYEMPGIVQVQTNTQASDPSKHVTFASAMREFLRQDPDVILVGEIRDEETAAIAIQAALTGHLVLSTLHTNDAVGIVNRLKNQNVQPFLIASTLLGGVAQRLVRKLCPDCKQRWDPDAETLELFVREGYNSPELYQAGSCAECHERGYRGRVGLYEILRMNEELRELIEENATAHKLRKAAERNGMKSLWRDGLRKAAAGIVSLSEVKRVCQAGD